MDLWNLNGKQTSITDALRVSIPERAVISVTGAGGKTSLIFAWARELAEEGKKVAITTTTHMHSPERMKQEPVDLYAGITCVEALSDSTETISAIDRALDKSGIALVFSPSEDRPGRIAAPPDPVLEHLYGTADVTLIEADGSRRMPLKWPAPWEPAVPDRTDITVCVAGLSAVGKSTAETVYRADELPAGIARDTVDVNLIHKMLSSRDGGQKGARGEFRVFLNQVDDITDRLAAAYRLQQILSVFGIQTAWGSLQASDDEISGQSASDAEADNGSMKLAIILEAAGNSTRFGSNKLLHIMDDGRPMAACIMDAVSDAISTLSVSSGETGLSFKKILVTQYDEVAALAPDFEVVINDRPDLGISRSMQLGIGAAGDADAYMFCVCDQPYLKAGTLVNLIDTYIDANKKRTAGIISLAWQGKMCNPKIFSSKYKDELMSLSGDTGGRQIISAHPDDITLVEAGNEIETMDIDSI